ncbi:MAG: hypothetical protein ACFFEN_09765 [Candidatus Thorarchaeota archaeon]
MQIKIKKEGMLVIGMFSFTIALFLDRFAGQGPLIDFFCGLFTGLSIITNLGFLIKYRLEKKVNLKV